MQKISIPCSDNNDNDDTSIGVRNVAVDGSNDMKAAMLQRDRSVQRLLFDEVKFHYARHMGADFAPKAADISASIVGPIL